MPRLAPYILPALLALTTTAQAQVATPATRLARAVNPVSYRAHLQFLADDQLEGRAPATRGGDLAAKYIAAQFQRLGLEPAGDSETFFHRVPVIALNPSP